MDPEKGEFDESPAEVAKTPPSPAATAVVVFLVALISPVIAMVTPLFAPEGTSIDTKPLLLLAGVLGVYLVARLALALARCNQAKSHAAAFYAACSTLAVSAANVQEVLTISAGAEHEKQGVRHFRGELSRLLAFAARCFAHAARDEPVAHDQSLMTMEEVLAIRAPSRPTPTLFAVKGLTKLVAQQRDAGRLDQMLCMHMNAQLAQMVQAFQGLDALKKMPVPSAVSELAFWWVLALVVLLMPAALGAGAAYPSAAAVVSLVVSAFFLALHKVASHLEDLQGYFATDGGLSLMEASLAGNLAAFVPAQEASGANGAGML